MNRLEHISLSCLPCPWRLQLSRCLLTCPQQGNGYELRRKAPPEARSNRRQKEARVGRASYLPRCVSPWSYLFKKIHSGKNILQKCLKERRDRAEYTGTLLECGGGCQVTPSWLVWNEKMPTSACIFQRWLADDRWPPRMWPSSVGLLLIMGFGWFRSSATMCAWHCPGGFFFLFVSRKFAGAPCLLRTVERSVCCVGSSLDGSSSKTPWYLASLTVAVSPPRVSLIVYLLSVIE